MWDSAPTALFNTALFGEPECVARAAAHCASGEVLKLVPPPAVHAPMRALASLDVRNSSTSIRL